MTSYKFVPSPNSDNNYDLTRDGKTIDVDVQPLPPENLFDSMRRARVPGGTEVPLIQRDGARVTLVAR